MLDPVAIWIVGIPALVMTAAVCGRRRAGFSPTLGWLALVAYLCVLLAATLFPLPFDPAQIRYERASEFQLRNNFVPFLTVVSALRRSPDVFARQVGGNVALFIPLGLLLPALWPSLRSPRRMFTVVASAALGVELVQFAISAAVGYTYRQADIDDVLLNLVGGLMGYWIFRLFGWASAKILPRGGKG